MAELQEKYENFWHYFSSFVVNFGKSRQGRCVRTKSGAFFKLKSFGANLFRSLHSIGIDTGAPALARSEKGFYIQKTSWPSLFFRSLCGTIGLICNFYAIDKMNIADANILNKLSPFFAIIASYFILKEKANKVEWSCVLVAFLGAVFVVKPSFEMEFVYAMIGVAGGLGAGVAYTFVRKLGKQGERGPVIVMCFSVFSCVVTFLLSFHEINPYLL